MMEAWPAAWVLILTLIADWLEAAQSRDFTVKDIILLHPSTTPHPGGFKCFTCKDAPDNYECNRWAPDVYCPRETRYCYTLHVMDVQGNTVSVTKRCVPWPTVCLQAAPRTTMKDTRSALLAVKETSVTCSCQETRRTPSFPPPLSSTAVTVY
nr:ly6/PLAUR domain-containing protein 6-like [Salvelinus alpinus]